MLWCWPAGLLVGALGLLGGSGRLGLDAVPFALHIDEVTPLAGRPGRAVLLGRVLAGSVDVGEVVTVQCGDEALRVTLVGVETISPAADQDGTRTALIVRGLRRGWPARGDWVRDDRDRDPHVPSTVPFDEDDVLPVFRRRDRSIGMNRCRSSVPHDSERTAIQRNADEWLEARPDSITDGTPND